MVRTTTSPYLNLLRNQIDITRVPFSDRGSRMLVLQAATTVIEEGPFRLLGGHKFLEAGPRLAHKGQTVSYLLDNSDWPDALPVYLGDDDKDEEAFAAIHARGGVAIVIAAKPRPTQADCRLESPPAARRWLNLLQQELT